MPATPAGPISQGLKLVLQADRVHTRETLDMGESIRSAPYQTMSNASGTGSYEVALSFAGEDRPYVAAVAAALKAVGVTVFYDADEQAALWGEDLYVYLDKIYRKATQYCVMFISEAYARKLWTNHERMSLQARDFINAHDGSVLPARFDDTEIPGLRPQIGYINLRTLPPEDLALLVTEKVRGKRQMALARALQRALSLAKDYLLPQSLASSDSIAQEIRSAFASTGYVPNAALVEPYIISEEPSERVVGYLAYQMAPYMGVGELLHRTLEKEINYCTNSKETRPLWQLLVCVGLFGAVTNPEEMQFVNLPLRHALASLQRADGVDVGGQCAAKLNALIAVFPWMCDRGEYTWFRAAHVWDFVWVSGTKTYGLPKALEYIRSYPQEARFHVESGHFSPWYEINLPHGSNVSDLMSAIAKEIAAGENH